MSVTVVQTATNAALSAPTTTGNILVVGLQLYGQAGGTDIPTVASITDGVNSFTLIPGSTATRTADTYGERVAFYYCPSIVGQATETVTVTTVLGTYIYQTIWELTPGTFDQATAATGDGASISAGTLTPSADGAQALEIIATNYTGTWTFDSGWTATFSVFAGNGGSAMGSFAQSTAAALPFHITGGLTFQWAASGIVFIPIDPTVATVTMPLSLSEGVSSVGHHVMGDVLNLNTATVSGAFGVVLGYSIIPIDAAGNMLPEILTGSTGTTFSVPSADLVENDTYTFMVRAITSTGKGPPSLPSAPIIPQIYTPPSPPMVSVTDLVLYAGDGEAILFFRPIPTIYDGGAAVTNYLFTEADIGWTQAGTWAFSFWPFNAIANNVSYRFTARAININGTGPASLPSNSVTTLPGLPGQPTAGAGTVSATPGQIDLTWGLPSPAPTASITDYIVIPVVDGVPQTPVDTHSTALAFSVTGLISGTPYTFRIQPVNSVGPGLPCYDVGPLTPA